MAEAEEAGDKRPSPEALLALAEREERGRGRLRVFLGAAPGVGKTYAMLSGARRLRAEGVDVVVGLVETHGRADTAALIEGIEVLARKPVPYRGRVLMEFDIDAALARRPALLVVDELAHTNAPDSRHPKRYQDVEELVAAGIDVWTALNIQHLESLSDVVSRLTGVRVRETVPDTVLEAADEVVVVDITPDELIARLKEGKVYLPENARRAVDHFFKPANLTALRELALRRTADRVDDQMVAYLRQNAIEGPWPTAERLLVCVGPDPLSATVVRTAGRLASGLNASWVAVHLDRPDARPLPAEVRQRLDETLRLAERLGAETARLTARDLPEELLRYARRENITQIVLGRSRAGLLARLMRHSLPDEIVRRAADIGVHIVTDAAAAMGRERRPRSKPEPRRLAHGLAGAALAVAAAVALGLGISHVIDLPNISMIFLAAVVLCALLLGRLSAVAAAVLSFLAYNFFFIEPVHTFTVAKPHELFALVIFLFVATTVGSLAGRVRDQAEMTRRRVVTTQALYDFSRKLSGTAKLEDVLWAVVAQVQGTIGGRILLFLPEGRDIALAASWPPEDQLEATEWAAARWAYVRGEVAGWRSKTLPKAQHQFRPLRTSQGTVGVIGVQPKDTTKPLAGEDERALEAILDQAAVAIERTRLVDETAQAKAAVESERLRSALLSSISHDLRTPLASILGAVTSLRDLGGRMPQEARDDLLAAIEEETRRLSRFVSNLLDMTRLEAGALDLARDWIDMADVLRAAMRSAATAFPGRAIDVRRQPGAMLVKGNAALLEQVLFNLLDNADKYAGRGTPTVVSLTREGDRVVLAVTDEGPGIPADQLDRVFDKFHRVAHGDGRAAGTGLGLAICRGIVGALGGTIRAESPVAEGRGTRLVVTLPAGEPVIEAEAKDGDAKEATT
ncbi:sensor histidine kinase KdpD [Chelatococcus sp. SYSU_G07232]|uniref:histidine kinase n=1 Tax=Chelatococcus albus TaxID=3047466 RepID=A0ABT7AD99_9HYPH|nr:sensor histidine kinase KdpD [Chelatococcus sp. SYSU_G07232]MDJ1157324.1 sensor histidine kinase KdpD [Chelatococcus sp. SYSU_G07232]